MKLRPEADELAHLRNGAAAPLSVQRCMSLDALGLRPLATHPTDWEPYAPGSGFKVTLNLALDGCIVPSLDGARRRGGGSGSRARACTLRRSWWALIAERSRRPPPRSSMAHRHL